ncbi:hypothetical protein BU26DRAFT_307486 [Trematosphaeria pertusa]|uniref:Plasmid pRiA4b Orf3-like domain-containing protein n=1 Tax=Trematosphaeria pertusa TaxID=390896 RepID=A0A6A6IE30_9PLEO|nr:uncharacterized protein BU26DRAFT_307486 [Trematosphaeria pertusa]KAF2248835.1 hypothetical protein BU26DRAFT_307486 [Trematosphaeria pertusa]
MPPMPEEHIGLWRPPPVSLPEPTTDHVVLKFILETLPKIFRTIRMPLNYHFGHLHYLLQYTMGWTNLHLHKFDVCGPMELYKSQGRKGAVKKYGEDLVYVHQIGHDTSGDPGSAFSREETRILLSGVWNHENEHRDLANGALMCAYLPPAMRQHLFLSTWLNRFANENICVCYMHDVRSWTYLFRLFGLV